MADKLAEVALTITAKVSANGTIYGSVNSVMIADELKKLGFEIDRKLISIKDVKKVGDHTAVVRLHKEISVSVPVTVVPEAPVEEATAEPAPAAPTPEPEAEAEEEIEEEAAE